MKVLVVEDDESSRLMLEDSLRFESFEVISAENGQAALKLLEGETRPDVIVSDILMPEMDGFELCRQLKATPDYRQIPFIFYTATYTSSDDEYLAMSLGASRFVVKPVPPGELVKIINAVCAESIDSVKLENIESFVDDANLDQLHVNALNKKLQKKISELEQERNVLHVTEQSLRRSNRTLNTMLECKSVLVQSSNENMLFEGICKLLVNTSSYWFAWTGIEEGNGKKTILPQAHYGLEDDYLQTLAETSVNEKSEQEPVIQAIRENQIIIINDIAQEKESHDWRQQAFKRSYRSVIALPFSLENKVKGALGVYSHEVNAFNEEEVHMLTKLVEEMLFGLNVQWNKKEKQDAIDDKMRLEYQLQQMQKMEVLGHLAGGIAHDFNNVLSVILGYTTLALSVDSSESRKKLDGYLEEIQKAGGAAKELVAQLLAFSRRGEKNSAFVNATPVVKEIVAMLQSTLPSSIVVKTSVGNKTAAIDCDITKMQQLVMNLMVNARDAIKDKGEIKIGLSQATEKAVCSACNEEFSGDYVILDVCDTGPGFTANILERVFEPFFTTKSADKGSGLGLSIVNKVIHSCNGHVVIDTTIRNGASVRLYFPAITEKEKTPFTEKLEGEAESVIQQYPPEKCDINILVVDDEFSLARFLKEFLELHGYSVITFNNSKNALEYVKKAIDKIDLVITDQTMPGLTGAELSKEILKLNPSMPIIMCTGYSEHLSEQVALAIGIKKYMNKPIETQELLACIKKYTKETVDQF